MTPLETIRQSVAQVEEMDKAATKGPWCAESDGVVCHLTGGPIEYGPGQMQTADWLADFDRQSEVDDYQQRSENACNAEFAAEARTLLPAMAMALQRATVALGELGKHTDGHGYECECLQIHERALSDIAALLGGAEDGDPTA